MAQRNVKNTFFYILLLLLPACTAPQTPLYTPDLPKPQILISTAPSVLMDDIFTVSNEDFCGVKPDDCSAETTAIEPTPTLMRMINSPTPALPIGFFRGSFAYALPHFSQKGLTFNGAKTNSGCTAASVFMLTDFWNRYRKDYPVIRAQSLINTNAAQGTFKPGIGLSVEDTADELHKAGYYLGTVRNSEKQSLIDALQRYGPLAVLVKTNWVPNGLNHAAVVIAYNSENDTIKLNDPWMDEPVTWNYDAFDGIWGLNYSQIEGSFLSRVFFFVVPYSELQPTGNLLID